MKKTNQKNRTLIYYISAFILTLSLAVIVYCSVKIVISNYDTGNALSKWDNEVNKPVTGNTTETSKESILPSRESNNVSNENDAVNIDINDKIFGSINFPTLNERAAILEGTDFAQLNKGAGHYKGTAMPGDTGNCVLTGHNDTVFKDISSLKPGDEITIETRSGRYKYIVKHANIIDDSDLSCLVQGSGKALTLITCYPLFYLGTTNKRYVVTAEIGD